MRIGASFQGGIARTPKRGINTRDAGRENPLKTVNRAHSGKPTMIDDPTVAQRIQESILRHADAAALAQLPAADLAQAVRDAAAAPVRVADARWMSADVLVWNRNNLRPAVREALENTLVRRVNALCSQRDLKPEPALQADPAEEEVDAAAAPPPSSPKEDPPAPKPLTASAPTPRPPQKEDWFDGFLTFMSNLFS